METRASSSKKAFKKPARLTTSCVIRLQDKIVNSYLVSEPDSDAWIIVDAGMSAGHAKKIILAAEEWFGQGARPSAIVLTHAHFDHIGAVERLLEHWNVPVYAHLLELPYLTGRSDYPPPDPTVGGGLMARMSPLFSRKGCDLNGRVQALPEHGLVPHMPSWRWIHTPGHTPGHVSLFREQDRALIAGDAFVTVKNESAIAVLLKKEEVNRPPAYFTTDWEQARKSVEVLAELRPEIAATGHGVPMRGSVLRGQLEFLAANFDSVIPRDGRYVRHPAVADSNGVQFIPPKVPDPLPKVVAAVAAGAVVAVMLRRIQQKRRRLGLA